jgi:hypothetical protein
MGYYSSQPQASSADEHVDIREQLYAYAAEQVLHGHPETVSPHIAAHLQHCVACRAELAELIPALELAYNGDVALTAPPPAPQAAPRNPSAEEPLRIILGKILIQFSEAVLAAFRAPQPALAGLPRGRLFQFTPDLADFPSLAHLEVAAALDHPDSPQAQLSVQVLFDTDDPFAAPARTVIVTIGPDTWTAQTDGLGRAAIGGVPVDGLARMQIQVDPAE